MKWTKNHQSYEPLKTACFDTFWAKIGTKKGSESVKPCKNDKAASGWNFL